MPPLSTDGEAGEAGCGEMVRNASPAPRVPNLVTTFVQTLLSPPPPLAPSCDMSGIEIVGIVLAIPGILDLINRAAVAIKNVRCPIALCSGDTIKQPP